jgi:hypothetical protein
MRTRLLLVVAAILVALGASTAAARTASQGAPEAGAQGGPRAGQCEDGLDNDNDGATDADDLACQQPGCLPSSQTPQKCEESTLSPENPEAGNCDDGIDNDGDGLTDGEDPDCQTTTPENPDAGNCDDGIDNDGDGLTDGEDPDCQTTTPQNLCTGAAGDPGVLTEDTLGQTLEDAGLGALNPLVEDPERNGAISGPLGEALTDTPLEVVGDEASCAVDLVLDENTFPDL